MENQKKKRKKLIKEENQTGKPTGLNNCISLAIIIIFLIFSFTLSRQLICPQSPINTSPRNPGFHPLSSIATE